MTSKERQEEDEEEDQAEDQEDVVRGQGSDQQEVRKAQDAAGTTAIE